jgi:uncharacterized protein (TIGR02246 family)
MRMKKQIVRYGAFLFALLAGAMAASAQAPSDPDRAAIRASDEQLVKAFNSGQAEAVAALFLPQGELIDDAGGAHRGQQAIRELLTQYFAKFPGVQLVAEVESLSVIGPVAIEEGSRHTMTKDGNATATVHFTAVRTKVGDRWLIASLRDYADEAAPTPHEQLEPLSWLVGNWVNESSDALVKITYRWSDDGNFLLGEFDITRGGQVVMKSTQRIGWDPLAGKIRSWMFDSDGGWADGFWTQVEDAWVIKSAAVLPDGQTGSATVTVTSKDQNRFTMKGTERIVGDSRDDDFEVTVVKPAPSPAK